MADPVLVAAAASQLRLIQEDSADEAPPSRQQRLNEVLRQHLDNVLPQDRRAFLEQLQDQFPTWEENAIATDPQPAAAPPSDEPLALAQQLLDSLRSAGDADRKEVAELLRAAGIAAAAGPKAELPEQLLGAIRQSLGLAPTDAIDIAHVTEVVRLLIDFAAELDPLVWRNWRAMSPRANFPRLRLRDVLRSFVKGQREVTALADIANLRMLIAPLINALTQVPRFLCQRHLAKFDPAAIEAAVEATGISSLQRATGKVPGMCWKKYIELAPDLDRAAFEKAFNDVVDELVPNRPELKSTVRE